MTLFGAKYGFKILGSDDVIVDIINGAVTPSISGIAAPEGSLYLKTDGISYKKTGPADVDWLPYSEIDGGAGLTWATISGATTAEVSKGYILDSSAGVFTVTMPAAPSEGDIVGFVGLGDVSTNNVTIDLNGLNMNGSGDDLTVDLDYCYFEMLYTGNATTGWVLSNTDESGNVDNIRSFIGNDDNVDPAVTEYTEENYIVDGDPLEDAIDKLDIALFDVEATASGVDTDLSALEIRVTTNEGDIITNASGISENAGDIFTNTGNISINTGDISTNAGNISTNASGIEALESYTGSNGASLPDYNQEYYISDGDPLEEAVSKLDDALNTVASLAATGVSWRAAIVATTGDVVASGVGAYTTGDYFSDDDAPLWLYEDWLDGDEILSINTTTSGMIYTWNSGADQWVHTYSLTANEAVSCRYDFPDAPGSQEDGAAYMMNSDETEVIKIADFDWEDASTIGLSDGYTASSGTVTSSDSVESAIEKLDGNITNIDTDLTTLEGRVTTNEGDIFNNAGAISINAGDILTNAGDIITNASGISDNASDISDLEDAVGSSTGLAGMDYTSNNYVTDNTSAVDAISALDEGLTATASGIDRIDINVDNLNEAHNNLADAVLTEATTSVPASTNGVVVDTVLQAGNLCAKWFVIAYDGGGNRYACEIYGMHDGSTGADLTEYAILTIGTKLKVDFDIEADGTNMTLTVDNRDTTGVTVKTQRITVQVTAVDTTAVITS